MPVQTRGPNLGRDGYTYQYFCQSVRILNAPSETFFSAFNCQHVISTQIANWPVEKKQRH